MPMKGLETERLLLQPYKWEHLEPLHDILSDAETMKFWPEPFTIEQTRRWMVQSIGLYASGLGRLGIFLKSDGTLIGDAGLRVADIDGNQENDLGYIIDKRFWGKGYGTEAASAVLKYGLEELKLQRICANMPADHIGSRMVAVHLDMEWEKQFLNSKNRNIVTDLYVYAVRD